jgi:hypothetical protein
LPDYAGGWLSIPLVALFIWHFKRGVKIEIHKGIEILFYCLPLEVLIWRLVASWQDTVIVFLKTTDATTAIPFEFAITWSSLFLKTGGAVLALVCFLLIWRYGSDRRKFVDLTATGAVLLLLVLSLLFWYRPDKWNRFYLQQISQDPIPAFSRLIPEKATVYWEEDLLMSWFALGRSNYASKHQLAGLAFNRQTAMEGIRRSNRLASLGLKESIITWDAANSSKFSRKVMLPPSFEGLVHACNDPALDFVVLSTDWEQGIIARHFEKVTEKYFYLYDCAELRQGFADTWAEKEAPQ